MQAEPSLSRDLFHPAVMKSIAVTAIPDDRVGEVVEMSPQLMGASCLGVEHQDAVAGGGMTGRGPWHFVGL